MIVKALLSDSYDCLELAALRVLSVINTVTLGKKVVELSNLLTYSFNKINTILNVPPSTGLDSAPEICERFLRFFTDKVVSTGACISQPSCDPSIPLPGTSLFDQFKPVSLSFLKGPC